MSVIGAIGFMVTAGLLFNMVFSSKDKGKYLFG